MNGAENYYSKILKAVDMLGASAEREKQRQFMTGRDEKRWERQEKQQSLMNKLGYLRGISGDKALTPESRQAALQKEGELITSPDTEIGGDIAARFIKPPTPQTYKLRPETYGMFSNITPEQEFKLKNKLEMDKMELSRRQSEAKERRLRRAAAKRGKGKESEDRNYLLMLKKDAVKLHEKSRYYTDPDTGERKKEKGLPARLNYFTDPVNKILAKNEKDWTAEDKKFIEELKPYDPEMDIPKDRPMGQKFYEQFKVD